MIKAIETHYKGYKFRSRLEARYAVFFDRLGIEWEYEVEGYVLPNSVCYLPDFYLPTFNGGMYVEIKGKEFTDEEKEKCFLLCEGTNKGVWLANGKPDYRCYEVYYWEKGKVLEGDGIPNADQAEFENRMFGMSAYGKTGEMMNIEYRKLIGGTFAYAVKCAKQARFEHGEKP
jgi:hypothetical protein